MGFNVNWENDTNDSDEAVRLNARRLFDQIVGMGANSVSVSIPFYTDSLTSSVVRTTPRTPDAARTSIVMDEAARSGLRTTLRVVLDQTNLMDPDMKNWRGTFSPVNRAAWYSAYRTFLAPYLAMAQAHHVTTVTIGTELGAMQSDPHWRSLVADARTIYAGQLSYSANWDSYPTAVAGIPVDSVDIDAYPILGLTSAATDSQMTAAWRRWLVTTAPPDANGLVLSEVGGPADDGLLAAPYKYGKPGSPLDEEIQSRWFGAACRAARDQRLGGLYWWKIDFSVDLELVDPVTDPHDSFLGRSAEQTIRECFAAWAHSS